ncbi:glutaredoxin 3, partial [Phenoliferia sp. Uapishka_3]
MLFTKRLLFLLPVLLITFTLSIIYKSFGASILRSSANLNRTTPAFAAFSNSSLTSARQQIKSNMSVKSAVDKIISEGHVVVFSKSYCPYCTKTKNTLKALGETADVHELDQMDEGSDWQAYLAEKSGQRTVPQIFIDGKFIGGNSDLEAKKNSGELKKLLA